MKGFGGLNRSNTLAIGRDSVMKSGGYARTGTSMRAGSSL